MQVRVQSAGSDRRPLVGKGVDDIEAITPANFADRSMLPGRKRVVGNGASNQLAASVLGLVAQEPFRKHGAEVRGSFPVPFLRCRVTPNLHEITCLAPTFMRRGYRHVRIHAERHAAGLAANAIHICPALSATAGYAQSEAGIGGVEVVNLPRFRGLFLVSECCRYRPYFRHSSDSLGSW